MSQQSTLNPDIPNSGAKVHSRRSIYTGRVFELAVEQVTLENGVSTSIDVLYHPGAAAVIGITDSGCIPLIHQYRHAVKSYIWEIPAGTRNHLEPHENCARRELMEETGYLAESLEFIGDIIPVPGYSNERIAVFLALGLNKTHQNLDDDELIKVYEFPISSVLDMAMNGEIVDAKTLCSLFMASGKKLFDKIKRQ